jgi:ATP-dependent helicase YprA (DUF1998 family)
MHLTPSEAFEHIKESVIEYLETAYKIAHPAIFAERGELLRQRGVVAQAPFIESTPAFPPARKLAELETLFPGSVSPGLAMLMQHGVPVDRFPLYTHQEEALLAATGERPNLLVATGTGSGKTESFILPILNDLLREAPSWAPVTTQPLPGRFDFTKKIWLHSRRHEQRPAAMRGIILYPMNALVNDQLSRLRRILARGTSPDWQKQQWRGNVIHFGMYTGLSQPTGHWSNKSKRTRLESYLQKILADWEKLRDDLRDTGNWPRPDSPEMLCRWDMQAAPPDILVTNYSMLEYMLVRPIEASIFDQTRQWLKTTPGARLTLVLDEAHTYTGAKGTEVAYLVRRLKERLGLPSGSPQFRAIATTASVPPGADEHLLQFVADLFGEPQHRFTLIHVGAGAQTVPERRASSRALFAFERFHQNFSLTDPKLAIAQLAADLDTGPVEDHLPPQVSLYNLLAQNHDIQWTRQRTARRATLLNVLANECWPGLETPERRERATAGVLSAGSFARAEALPDTPPLISVRMHLFFRGIYGLWACMDPHCPKAPALPPGILSRPVGKLFMDPRPWCECGARVLELFSCRQCGLLYLGGIPDSAQGSLWPWSDDLSGDRVDFRQFQIFGVEAPDAYAPVEYRSTRTTLHTHPEDMYARPVYSSSSELEDERPESNFPNSCPRCRSYRELRENGREIVEPLRTKGPRAFSILAEDGFRVQSRATHGVAPNYGRKTLLFTDSRQEAAQLAADLRDDHYNDVFRQLVYRALMSCPECQGEGRIRQASAYRIGQEQTITVVPCPTCQGTGRHPCPQMHSFQEIRSRVLQFQLDRGIDPTNGAMKEFFKKSDQGYAACFTEAEKAFHVALRRELSERREFALEPLGLACWRVRLPEDSGEFPHLSEEETRLFLQAVTRILATEHILLPPEPLKPWEWSDQVKDYERNVLIWGFKRETDQGRTAIPYNLSPNRKLGRYVIAVSQALVAQKRLPSTGAAKQWVRDLELPLWKALQGFQILSLAGRKFGVNEKVPFGIRIDAFDLYPLGETVQRCNACAYIMGETLFHVCLRCGQQTSTVAASSIQSFYRRAALHALPGSGFDDPYPLRAAEHTAQIPGREARDEERWFQDLFHDHQHPNDYRVDVLSVTTTMEMGIDIGSLLNVGMRNIPPTVANYQQRAGRAGRRGSALATVLSFAQFRSHDQYYFAHPPEIVSFPPRVPALYLANEVIARRHVRSLLLQSFFYLLRKQQVPSSSNLFEAWGKVDDFINMQGATRLRRYLTTNRDTLLKRCQQIVEPEFVPSVGAWMGNLVTEVQQVLNQSELQESVLDILIHAGLLPKYAFPVDVVSLFIPSTQAFFDESESNDNDDAMQRDLKVALGEYAPGAEVIRQEFPNTYIYRSIGVYDRYNANPDYSATGTLVECTECQSVALIHNSDELPDQCEECGSLLVTPLPYLRPKGFTVDCALPDQGRERYQRGGRERSGSVLPARLMVGRTSFQTGKPCSFAPRLYVRVRQGDLFTCNKGPNPDFPGFLICPVCGRALDPDQPGSHTYPAHVPPFRGKNAGPRAGTLCPNTTDFRNQVILGHRFVSEVILLGVDLPEELDAPFQAPSGKAVWYSFGILVANAAALVLQIDQAELKIGVRAVRRTPGNRLHGEVFLYDDVPGGAGYARAIEQNLEAILRKALELGEACPNPDCQGACYHCMFDYRNQTLHPLLDRKLGAALLRFLLHGDLPDLDPAQVQNDAIALAEYARTSWTILPGTTLDGQYFPLVLRDPDGVEVGLWVIHPLQARPTREERQAFLSGHGMRCAVHTTFDLERRPFWVLNNLTW